MYRAVYICTYVYIYISASRHMCCRPITVSVGRHAEERHITRNMRGGGGGGRGECSRVDIFKQPVVLIAADGKVIVVGKVDHMSRASIYRVPQRTVRATAIGHNAGRVACNIGLELCAIGSARRIVGMELGLQLVVPVVWYQGDPA